MTIPKKQQKINKLFRRGINSRPVEDLDEIQEEVQLLENELKEKQNELFQLQRNSYRRKASPVKKVAEPFISAEKIILNNSVESLKQELELTSMLSGIEVQSYAEDDHCCIIFHMQHDAEHVIKHGLRIETKSGINEISKSSFPLGFNFDGVMEDFDNIMTPACLQAIRKALLAYYSRLEQFDALKKSIGLEAQLFKILDGSHMEISFLVKSDVNEEEEPINVVLMLNYRVDDVRPKSYSFKELDLPEGAVVALEKQCEVFRKKPLHEAFKKAFVDGFGLYRLMHQVGEEPTQRPRAQKRPRAHRHDHINDDTFRPEDCPGSDSSDGDETE